MASERSCGLARARRPVPGLGKAAPVSQLGEATLLLSKDSKDVKDELKAALQGLQALGARTNLGLGHRTGQRKETAQRTPEKRALQKENREPEVTLQFDTAVQAPKMRFSGNRMDCFFHLGSIFQDEELVDVEEDEMEMEGPAQSSNLWGMMKAEPSSTFSCPEDEVDVWDEDDDMDDDLSIAKGLVEASIVTEPVQQLVNDEQAQRDRLNREFACHFVQAVMDSALIQAVRGPKCLVTPRRTPPTMGAAPKKAPATGSRHEAKMVVPELDMSQVEIDGLAALTQRSEALLDRQLSSPPSPVASAFPLLPSAPPSAPNSPPATRRAEPEVQPMAPRAPTAEGSPKQSRSGGLRPCKSHRRIIGGVVRSPVPADAGAVSPSLDRGWASPMAPRAQPRAAEKAGSSYSGPKVSKQPKQKSEGFDYSGPSVVFRMDNDEPSMSYGAGNCNARGSSLVGRYEALGADFYDIPDEVDFGHYFGGSMRSHSPPTNEYSAMAMDICGDSAPRFSRTNSSSGSVSKTSSMKKSPSHGSQHSYSKHAPPVISNMDYAGGKKKQGLLPDLPSAPCSGSLAWTRRLNRPASRCALTGPVRGALDSVF